MDVLIYLIPIALLLCLLGLAAFVWSIKSGQYDDLDGAANRILIDDDIEGCCGVENNDIHGDEKNDC